MQGTRHGDVATLPRERRWAPAAPAEKPTTKRRAQHRLLTVTVLALPFSYIPLELVPTRVSVTLVVFALVVATGIRYGVLRQRPGALEAVTLLFSAYIFVRLTALAALQSGAGAIDVGEALSATLAPIGGVILYRVARRDDTKDACLRALRWMLVMLAVIAGYQAVVGLDWLQSRGYTDGFYYFTFDGDYRAFGTFLSPTVFGAFLAVVGAALVCMAPTIRGALIWLGVAIVPLALTETRAAWIAFGVALLAGWLLRSRARPAYLTLGVAAAVWGIAFIAWLAPQAVGTMVARLATVTDSGFSSNLARVHLWEGALDVTLSQSPIIGLPADEFVRRVGMLAGKYAEFGHAHSNFLQILFLYGTIGLVLFVAILLISFGGSLRMIAAGQNLPWAYGGIAAIVAFAIDSAFETSWTSFSMNALLYLLIGLGHARAGTEKLSIA
ncbi:O-antigen ligase family protein [Agrococcus citreus]|uniref:O-antigen ligase-related domain-containing protein n=1 Tax=Agrococcus citreus TaxID=84643 RepID=A0ABN1YTG3_9MICO